MRLVRVRLGDKLVFMSLNMYVQFMAWAVSEEANAQG